MKQLLGIIRNEVYKNISELMALQHAPVSVTYTANLEESKMSECKQMLPFLSFNSPFSRKRKVISQSLMAIIYMKIFFICK